MKDKLVKIFENIGIVIDSFEEEIEIDSFQFINIIVEIENVFLITINEKDLDSDKYNSFAEFYSLIQKYTSLLKEF